MTGVLIIYRRELAGLFLAPLAWILLCATLLYSAFFFLAALEQNGGEVNGAFTYMHSSPFWFLVVFLPPLLTMRMISEESKSGLLEFLLTAPVGDAAVVCGKLMAATTFLGIAWSFMLVYGVIVHALGAPPDWGQLVMQWSGALLVCALASSIGLMSSALCGTPLLAAFFAILANILLLVLPFATGLVRGPLAPTVAWIVDKFNVTGHYQSSFLSGALDTGDITFFLTWTAVALFCAIRMVESRRWMG